MTVHMTEGPTRSAGPSTHSAVRLPNGGAAAWHS